MRRHSFAFVLVTLSVLALGACSDGKEGAADDDSGGSSGKGGAGGSSSETGGTGGTTGGTEGTTGGTGGKGGGTTTGGTGGKGGGTTTGGTGGATGGAGGKGGGTTGGTGGSAAGSGGSGGSTGGSGGKVNNVPACEAATNNMADCGLIPAPVDCQFASGDLATACILACYGAASCEDLTASLCVGNASAFSDCFDACANVVLTCDDGTTTYLASSMCDGTDDCAGREDETVCEAFDCTNGTTVPLEAACDGDDDCENGADEADCSTLQCPEFPTATCEEAAAAVSTCGVLEGMTMTGCLDTVPFSACVLACLAEAPCQEVSDYFCTEALPPGIGACGQACVDTAPNAFFCTGGGAIAPAGLCDGVDDCADGSDELDCSFACGDTATSVHYSRLCDMIDDCPGGEDEMGCYAVCPEAN